MPEEKDDVDQEIMDLIKRARARRKGIAPVEQGQPAGSEAGQKKPEHHLERVGYRRRYMERRKKAEGRPEETPALPGYTPPEPSIPALPEQEEYSPPEVPEEIESELGLPEKEGSLSLAEKLEALEKPEPKACKTCGAIGTKQYYCPYCGTQFCTSCAKLLKKEGNERVYECPKCGREVHVQVED